MRITGGQNRNRAVRVPAGARPSGGRVREALFSIWAEEVKGALFLDLFAGSGAVGLEALSRGARQGTFVERPGRALRVLEANCRELGRDRFRIVPFDLPDGAARQGARGRAARLPASLDAEFDLVFADPPYAFTGWENLLVLIERLLRPGGKAAIEHSRRIEVPLPANDLAVHVSRTYGESSLTLYSRADSG